MIGAIAGDIIGSVYEFHNLKSKEFPLFKPISTFTDDSVLTIAIAGAILNRMKSKNIHFINIDKCERHNVR